MTGSVRRLLTFLIVLLAFFCFGVASSAACADADGDGALSAGDARIALRISAGLEMQSARQLTDCDLDYDGKITATDAREILRISVGFGRSDDSCADGMQGAQLVGITDKYYKIYRKNGVTYIDGILIANKTYGLPSNYSYSDYDPSNGLITACAEAFYDLQDDAESDGQYMFINSAYRSYSSQQSIYNSYVSDYGYAYAEAYAARPGHSEHQTGLAIDVSNSSGYFTGSSQAKWLHANCADYGFILRYPEGKSDKTGYNPEAWHIRYVGVEIAQKITNSGLCLEEYYGISSVYQ